MDSTSSALMPAPPGLAATQTWRSSGPKLAGAGRSTAGVLAAAGLVVGVVVVLGVDVDVDVGVGVDVDRAIVELLAAAGLLPADVLLTPLTPLALLAGVPALV